MSILIKDKAVPKKCEECLFYGIDAESGCFLEKCYVIRRSGQDKPSWCPLVPVPPHGILRKRLVYRGEVYNALEAERVNSLDGILTDPYKDGFHDGLKRALQILANEVEDAPTIIEAEEVQE